MRPFRASDGAALHLLYGDAENLRYWGTDPSPSAQRTQRMMSWHLGYRPRNYVLWAIEEIESRRLIGMINYHRRDLREKRVDMGWLILPEMQGNGYITSEADERSIADVEPVPARR